MDFKRWLENQDWGEYTHADIMYDIQKAHAAFKTRPLFGDPPEYCDPDDFYNGPGAVFTFTYSQRKVRDAENWVVEGLRIAPWSTTHYDMLKNNPAEPGDKRPVIGGRYGIKNHCPIVTIWDVTKRYLVVPCLQELLEKDYIRPDAYLYGNGINRGLVEDLTRIKRNPLQKKMIRIGAREYNLYDLPAFLHTLPTTTSEWQSIAQFICQNKDKYPYLKNVAVKAGCEKPERTAPPEWERRKQYFGTSEGQL